MMNNQKDLFYYLNKRSTRLLLVLHFILHFLLLMSVTPIFKVLLPIITLHNFYLVVLVIFVYFALFYINLTFIDILSTHYYFIVKRIEFDMKDYINLMQFLKDFSYDVDFVSHIKLEDYKIISKYLPNLKKFDQHFIQEFINKYGDK